jgi:membrane-associated phospholipid phosphatase
VLRRKLHVRPAAVLAGAALAPVSAAALWPRSRKRDVLICALQMYVYLAAYKMPNDDIEALEARVRIDYPIVADSLIGFGQLPTARLQRALHPDGGFSRFEKVLVWAHWVWFATPHLSMVYVLLRDRRRFTRAAVMTYAVFDLGALVYWFVPTAPPWYAAEKGRLAAGSGSEHPAVRRLMVEYGEEFWGDGWGPLYSVLGGNPLAAMPSLHFATSAMAALLLWETGPIAGTVGVTYAGVLGFSLVYLGEHYVADLLGGLALCLLVRRAEPLARAPLRLLGRAIEGVGRLARGPELS